MEVLQANRRKFDKLLKTREAQEEELMRSRFERVDDCERQLDTLRINDQEEYNMVKIKLETDVQVGFVVVKKINELSFDFGLFSLCKINKGFFNTLSYNFWTIFSLHNK